MIDMMMMMMMMMRTRAFASNAKRAAPVHDQLYALQKDQGTRCHGRVRHREKHDA